MLHHLMVHCINIALFYVARLMLDYFINALFVFALFDASLFTVELLNAVLF